MRKPIIFAAVLFYFFIFSCSSPKKKTYVVVVFDVEDYITPASEGIDDIPKWIAEIMLQEGVPGTFFVIGEKARSLERRRRYDVIEAMAKHDIASHTNYGSIHPTVTEKLENVGWNEGTYLMLEAESAGFKDLKRIFGTPITTLARHGGSYGPQLVNALGKMNAGYVYSPVHLPGKNAVWFCNTLNFHGEYGGFDNTYYRDDLFEPIFDTLKVKFPELALNSDVVTVFACHPCKMRTIQFWDFNFYYGVNLDSSKWKAPELRPPESKKTVQKNFRRLMKYLKNQDYIELTTFRDLMTIFSGQKEFITKKKLCFIAGKIINENAILIDDYFSPAEIFSGLAISISEYHNKNSLPGKIKRISPLGPMIMPPSQSGISKVTIEQVIKLAQEAVDYINKSNNLPSYLKVKDHKIGTGSLLALFSNVYLEMNSKKLSSEYTVQPFDAYPKINEKVIINQVKSFKNWPVHRRDLDMSRLVELTKMQLWTLKPAHVMK